MTPKPKALQDKGTPDEQKNELYRRAQTIRETEREQANTRADLPRPLIPTIIQSCDCDGFRKGNGIWFDSQDLRELGYRECPACKKPFKVEMR